MRPSLPQMLGCSLLCVPRMLVWIYELRSSERNPSDPFSKGVPT